jgi:hypothetical protein
LISTIQKLITTGIWCDVLSLRSYKLFQNLNLLGINLLQSLLNTCFSMKW